MAIELPEGNLKFNFEFDAIKFDDSQYYQNHFKKIQNGIAAVDFLTVTQNTGYLIKDYTHSETKPLTQSELIEAIINKVTSTLAAILPMKNNASIESEKKIASLFTKSSQIQVIFHIERPPPRRTLTQSCYNLQKMGLSLKERLKPIDAHPKIVSKTNLKGLPWTVT